MVLEIWFPWGPHLHCVGDPAEADPSFERRSRRDQDILILPASAKTEGSERELPASEPARLPFSSQSTKSNGEGIHLMKKHHCTILGNKLIFP